MTNYGRLAEDIDLLSTYVTDGYTKQVLRNASKAIREQAKEIRELRSTKDTRNNSKETCNKSSDDVVNASIESEGERMNINIQCSCCGYTERLSNGKVEYSVNLIKRGWGSCGSALYCPECTKSWCERNNNRKMADERNTFILIMRLFFDAINRKENNNDIQNKETV